MVRRVGLSTSPLGTGFLQALNRFLVLGFGFVLWQISLGARLLTPPLGDIWVFGIHKPALGVALKWHLLQLKSLASQQLAPQQSGLRLVRQASRSSMRGLSVGLD